MPVHDSAGSFQHVPVDVGPVGQEVAYPFRMEIGPLQWPIEVAVGERQKEVAKAGRIENIGVMQCRQARQRLLQTEFLIASAQFVERLAAAGFHFASVSKKILDADAAV